MAVGWSWGGRQAGQNRWGSAILCGVLAAFIALTAQGNFGDGPVTDLAGMALPGVFRRREPLLLGRYHVTKALRAGEFASTYAAHDTKRDESVVVKLYRGVEPRVFLREAKALEALDHPNVVALHQVRRTTLGACLVAEDAGTNLDERISQNGPMHAIDLRNLAHDLMGALEAVHAAGLLHRDVKPTNVFVNSDGRAKLGDFGAARLPSPHSTLAHVPGLGFKAGTLRYMSPERVRGMPDNQAGDLYGAAATLFEAWSGTPYLEVIPGESVSALMHRAACPPRRIMNGPAAMVGWFRRALELLPEDRFDGAAEMRRTFLAASASDES